MSSYTVGNYSIRRARELASLRNSVHIVNPDYIPELLSTREDMKVMFSPASSQKNSRMSSRVGGKPQ
jgi:hypothetical protein